MTQSDITIDRFTPDHIAEALKLSQDARWPHRAEDWALLRGISEGFVALEGGRVVGTAFMTPFGATGGGINMVIVSETLRGRGIGRRLFAATLDAARGRRLRLTATPDGEPLYRSLGFAPYGRIFQRQGTLGAVPDMPGAEDAIDADDAAILALDEAAFGEDRSTLLHALKQVGRFAVIRRDGTVVAFACLRDFGRGKLIGPVVAADTQDAQRLIAYLATGQEGVFMRLDITSETGLNDWLTGMGLPQTDDGLVMWTEPPTLPPAGAARTMSLTSQAVG